MLLESPLQNDDVLHRFREFNSAVGVCAERMGWVLSKVDVSQDGFDLLLMLHGELEKLVMGCDCTPRGMGAASTP